jgi:hypothetical protein
MSIVATAKLTNRWNGRRLAGCSEVTAQVRLFTRQNFIRRPNSSQPALDWTTTAEYDKMSETAVIQFLRAGVSPMTSHGRSPFTVIIVGAAALASFALVAAQVSRASAQAQAAQDREAKVKAQDAAVLQSKEAQAAKVAAANEPEAKEAQARAAAAAKGESVTLDLSKYLVLKPENFEKSKQYPWAVTPRGTQTFAGVPLEIQGATILWGKRNADRGQNYPEMVTDIPCQQKFETLYILQCVFFEADRGEPTFGIILNYEDGKIQSDEVLCGEDSKDWWVNDPNEVLGPSSKRSMLAWTGTGKANGRDQDVRFCLTAIDNKHPDRLVKTIDLVSSNKQSAGVILAITLSKAGLLKPRPEKPDKPAQPKDN